MSPDTELVYVGEVEVVVDDSPIEVPPALEHRIQEIWEDERAVRPGIVNGTIACFARIEGGRVSVRRAEYRLFIARERDTGIRQQLGLQAIGVSGIIIDPGGVTLLGRRADDVTEYPGAWELVPSGSLGGVPDAGRIDALAALLAEFEEETGIERGEVSDILPIGLVRDVRQDGYDVCYGLQLAHDLPREAWSSDEYARLTTMAVAEVLARAEGGERFVPTSLMLLALTRKG